MENKDYNYRTKPYSMANIFDVHALSTEGFEQYLSPKSQIHNYIDKLSTNNFKNFLYKSNDPNKFKQNNSSLLFSPSPLEENKEENEHNLKEEAEREEINPQKFQEESNKIEEDNKINFGYNSASNFFPKNVLQNIPKKQTKPTNMNKTNSNFFVKSNNDLLTRRLNFTASSFKTTKNPNNINRFDNLYKSNWKILSSKGFFLNKNKTENNFNKKTHGGFESFNVPRVENKNIDFKKPMNKLVQTIGKSCTGAKILSNENAFSKEKLGEVKQENKKLYKILESQTNKNFLKFANLPNISKVMDLPKLKIKKNEETEKVKHMGDRYNPYNFQAGRDCETMRRNQVGGLFNH